MAVVKTVLAILGGWCVLAALVFLLAGWVIGRAGRSKWK